MALCGALGCHKELALVTIEGEIAPELELHGEIYFRTFRRVFLCQGNLLETPSPQDRTVQAKFVRDGNHFKLTYDSSDAPRGGFCDWRPSGIAIDVNLRSRKYRNIPIVSLLPIGASTASTRGGRRVDKTTQVTCNIDYASRPPDPDCDFFDRILDDTRDEVHLTLNVAYEKGHKPVRN
jgi:hypothetical protein